PPVMGVDVPAFPARRSSDLGATSAVMLHLVKTLAPETKIICIDTGYLFPETYRFAEELTKRLGLKVHWFSAEMTAARQEALYGRDRKSTRLHSSHVKMSYTA